MLSHLQPIFRILELHHELHRVDAEALHERVFDVGHREAGDGVVDRLLRLADSDARLQLEGDRLRGELAGVADAVRRRADRRSRCDSARDRKTAGAPARNPRRVWIGTTALLVVMSLGLVWFNNDLTTGNSFRDEESSTRGQDLVVACMDFGFIGGSMGSVVGEKIARAIDYAREHRVPLLVILTLCVALGSAM